MNKIILNIRTFYIIFSRIRLPMYNLKIKNTIPWCSLRWFGGGWDRFAFFFKLIFFSFEMRSAATIVRGRNGVVVASVCVGNDRG